MSRADTTLFSFVMMATLITSSLLNSEEAQKAFLAIHDKGIPVQLAKGVDGVCSSSGHAFQFAVAKDELGNPVTLYEDNRIITLSILDSSGSRVTSMFVYDGDNLRGFVTDAHGPWRRFNQEEKTGRVFFSFVENIELDCEKDVAEKKDMAAKPVILFIPAYIQSVRPSRTAVDRGKSLTP